jgi:hypothetical protein
LLLLATRRDSDEDTKAMLRGLRSHKHQALILDAPVVQTMAAQVGTRR